MEVQNILTTVSITCQDCGNTFEVSPAEQKFYMNKKFAMPKRCPSCREAKKKDITTITCIDCGISFTIDGYEKEYFTKKGYPIPKRCRSCRDIKRKWNENHNGTEANTAEESMLHEGDNM